MKSKPLSPAIVVSIASLVLALLACSTFSSPGSPVSSASEPAPTEEVQPVESEAPTTETEEPASSPEPTEASAESDCYRWDVITMDLAGEEVCVYGTAYSHEGQSRLDFSPEKNSFFLIDPVYFYPDLKEGSCVVAIQKVEVFDHKIPFMTLKDGLYKCEPWMMEE